MTFRLLLLLFFANCLFATETFSQNDCECEDGQITLCYIPADNYCNINSGACGYTIDGSRMNDYLTPKLINSSNFGINGIVKCPIDLVPLSTDISVAYLEEQKCDIIFTGNFPLDTTDFSINSLVSAVPDATLSEIREWSEKCETNLVVIPQAEANLWGYWIDDFNVNPNFSVGNELGDFIFDGPFGKVESFNQGGSFQGVIVSGPSTGYTSLGVDNNGLPTLVIDNKTNDIILGDIGIFCGGNTGSVSSGPNINNDNDRLTANIFALVCQLAGTSTETIEVFVCHGEEYVRPLGGVVTADGTYVDSLLTENNCDSILTTVVTYLEESFSALYYDGCSGDTYELTVNGKVYNEENPVGEEILITDNGCDSLVTIAFEYKLNSESTYESEICFNDLIGVNIGNTIFNAQNPEGEAYLTSANGCDSIVYVFLDVLPENRNAEAYLICKGESIEIQGKTFDFPEEDVFILQAANGCDSIIDVKVDQYPEIPPIRLDNPLELQLNNDYRVNLNYGVDYSIEWSPQEILSCGDCFEFLIEPDYNYRALTYTITDKNGCTLSDSLYLAYQCPVYVPNAFAPSSENFENQSFSIYTPCLDLISEYEMKIFDRWGSMVFETIDPESSWDGKLNAKDLSKGVYVYVMKYISFNKEVVVTGDVTLF